MFLAFLGTGFEGTGETETAWKRKEVWWEMGRWMVMIRVRGRRESGREWNWNQPHFTAAEK